LPLSSITQPGTRSHHDWKNVISMRDSTRFDIAQRTMKNAFRSPITLAVLALAACTSPLQKSESGSYAPLILVSIDGYRADYLSRGHSPTLARLADDGVRAQALRSAFPTLTFPNHYTIVTGLYPDHHGIVNNRFVDPASGKHFVYNDPTTTSDSFWWGGEPIWVSIEKQGKHAATMFWPGSDVEIGGVRPEHWVMFDKNVSSDARVDHVLQWLDLPVDQRPNFVTLYFDAVDHAGHDFGPDSEQVTAALTTVDIALAHLLDGLKQRGLGDSTNIVVVSDHGMTPAAGDKFVAIDDVIALDKIDLVNTGVLAGIAAKPGQESSVEKALLAPHEHMTCWRKTQVPARFHYGTNARIAPYLCLADDGWMTGTREHFNSPDRHISLGEHGYDNDDPQMRALFVAHGPAFRHGLVVPEFDNVDIYPLLTKILGIRPHANDGDFNVVAGMLVTP
jgi:predicted AlkP superfamily pyrophosphatase or phosphodiesterase